MRNFIAGLLLVGGLVLIALYLFTFDRAGEGDPPSPRDPEFRNTYVPDPGPRVSSAEADRTVAATGAGTGESLSLTLEDLAVAAPTGDVAEWLASRYATDAEAPYTETWLTSILKDTTGIISLDEPPLVADLVFGPSDREWLESFRARFFSEVDAAKKTVRPTADGAYPKVLEEIRSRYRQVLIKLTRERYAKSDALRTRFADRRLLRELPEDSAQRRWLKKITARLGTEVLWHWHGMDRLRPRPGQLENISGADLVAVQQLVRSASRDLSLRGNPAHDSEEGRGAVEPYAKKFLELVNSR